MFYNKTDKTDISFNFGSNTITCDLTDAFEEIMLEDQAEELEQQQQKAKAEKREEDLLNMLNIFDEVKEMINTTAKKYQSEKLKEHM